jgi:hypothetical protein
MRFKRGDKVIYYKERFGAWENGKVYEVLEVHYGNYPCYVMTTNPGFVMYDRNMTLVNPMGIRKNIEKHEF